MRHTFSSPLFHMIVRALVLVILVFSTGVGWNGACAHRLNRHIIALGYVVEFR